MLLRQASARDQGKMVENCKIAGQWQQSLRMLITDFPCHPHSVHHFDHLLFYSLSFFVPCIPFHQCFEVWSSPFFLAPWAWTATFGSNIGQSLSCDHPVIVPFLSIIQYLVDVMTSSSIQPLIPFQSTSLSFFNTYTDYVYLLSVPIGIELQQYTVLYSRLSYYLFLYWYPYSVYYMSYAILITF